MKHSEVLNRYVNTGSQIPEEQYNQLSPSLKKSYKRMRGISGYEGGWELKMLTDDEKIKFIEKKGKKLYYYDIEHLLYYSENKDLITIKIIETKGEELHSNDIYYLLEYSDNKDDVITKIIENKGQELNGQDVDDLLKYSKDKDIFNRIIVQVINNRGGISRDIYTVLSPSLQKSYLRNRGFYTYGYDGWEFEFLTDDEIIKYIENNLHVTDIKHILKYSDNKDNIIKKIIENNKIDFEDIIYYLLLFSKDKELIKKLLLQNNVDYKLINNIILDNFEDIPLIPDNYQEMLNEIRRIKEIMK